MKLISLKMNNWLVFRGSQEVIFPPDDVANILIIFGENMHGKTSLLNAVRWALYGEALDRQKRIVPNEKLLNTDAETDGENSFNVTLTINAEDQIYEIFREAIIGQNGAKVTTVLKMNNRVKDGSDVVNIIESLVPKQISQFLLFDGELLDQFEKLVFDESSLQATAIKKSIEKALGLPVLQRAVEELTILQKSASKVFQTEMKKSRNLETLARNLERHENDLESKNKEKTSLEDQIESASTRINELDEELSKSSKNIEFGEKKKLLEEELNNNKKDIVASQNSLKDAMSEVWREPLIDALASNVKKIKEEILELTGQRKAHDLADSQIKELNKALVDTLCVTCGNKLDNVQINKVKEKLDLLEKSFANTFNLDEKIKLLNYQLSGITFQGLKNNASLDVHTLCNEKNRLFKRNSQIDDDLFDIRNELSTFDEERGRKIKNEYNVRSKEIGVLTQKIITIESDIELMEIEIDSIKKNPLYVNAKSISGSKDKLDTCDALLRVFKGSVSNYRESMRSKVGKRASDTFSNLTTEKKFDHLEINKSYGLNLIIDNKQVARSAGAEQIVALSLIEALNHLGRRKGPMLMDTPAGRLDLEHRRNVMNYLPQVVTQLALFAHSGELTEEDIYFDRSKIGRKYKITRKSPFHSILEES
jgi:DNA sulfur modification protein DndD